MSMGEDTQTQQVCLLMVVHVAVYDDIHNSTSKPFTHSHTYPIQHCQRGCSAPRVTDTCPDPWVHPKAVQSIQMAVSAYFIIYIVWEEMQIWRKYGISYH